MHLHIGGSGSGEGIDRGAGFVGGAYFEAAAVVFARGGSDGTETVLATSGGGTDGGGEGGTLGVWDLVPIRPGT